MFEGVNHIDRLTLEAGLRISDIWCVGCEGTRAALEVKQVRYIRRMLYLPSTGREVVYL